MFVCVFLVGSVQAQTEFSYPQNELLDLKIICINNGFCSSSSVCNVSIFDPDSDIIATNIQTTRVASGAYHNLTLLANQTSKLGKYQVVGFCKDGSVAEDVNFPYFITADGFQPSNFPFQFSIIALGFILICIGLMDSKLRLLKHSGSILIIVMGVLTLFPGYSFINWTTLTGKALGFIFIGLGFYFLIEDSFSRDEQEGKFGQEEEE